MKSICHYLCCGFCCSDPQKNNRKMIRKRQKKKLKEIESIVPSQKTKTVENKSPEEVNTKEMSDWYQIPNPKFNSESDLIKSLGYTVDKKFASGGFATVYTAVHNQKGLKVALKKVLVPNITDERSEKQRNTLMVDVKNELYILEKTDHPNVIKLIQHFVVEDSRRTAIYIIMQMAEGGNLSNKLELCGPFNERKCRRWFSQILSGLKYMHEKGFAHRDLKLSNILLDSAEDILISDFGLSRLVWRQSKDEVNISKTYCGTPPYMAPEVLELPEKREESPLTYGYNAFIADVWSLGVILYKLFTKRYPFNLTRGPARAVTSMKAKEWRIPSTLKPSDDLLNIFGLMFEPNPQIRIKLQDLTQHNWIKQTFEAIERKNSKIKAKK